MGRIAGVLALALVGNVTFVVSPAAEGDITSMPLRDQQTEIRTSIGGAAGRRPRLAIPPFLVTGVEVATQEAGKALADILWKDLEFEREFQMIGQSGDAGAIAPAPAESLAYDSWAQIGADEVLVGSVRNSETGLRVEVRVMNVGRKASSFARGYPCSSRNIRLCAHTIADEIHKERFGLDGVARTQLAFTSDRDGERTRSGPARIVKEIYVSDYDGQLARRATTRGSLNVAASWSPDGRAFAYQSYQSGFSDVYIQRLFEVQVQPERPARGSDVTQNYLPAWSPDGRRIAYASSTNGNWDIYVVNADGSDRRRLTMDAATDSAPAWSPTGLQIAFTSNRGGSNQVYVMSADGGPAEKLTSEAQHADRPSWASTNFLVYSAATPDNRVEIKRVNLQTRQVDQLTDTNWMNESPVVAPNGRHIAFVTSRFGAQEQIAVMDIDGANVRQVTFSGNNRFPNWSAGPRGR